MEGDQYLPPKFSTVYENYTLEVNEYGNVTIKAQYYPGVVRALDTLSQLIVQSEDDERVFTLDYAPIKISDEPSYPYRGIMIDTGREFFFPDIIKMVIDGWMLSRVNILHWHFAEDDSIAMYSKSFPDLVNYTAFTIKEVYKPDQVKDIVRYAKIRGVKIIPEMEGPAHLHILGFYPEFKNMVGCFRNYTSTNSRHGGPPYAPVNPADERTYNFLEKYLNDINDMFQADVVHLGGDEVNIGCISRLKGTQDFMKKHGLNTGMLQDYYIERERNITRKINPNITASYWYRGNNQKYGKDDILQFWGGSAAGVRSQIDKFPDNYFIISPSSTYYLDCGYTNQYAGGSWWGGLHSWKEITNVNPWNIVNDKQRKRFLGGELPAWSEMNNEYNLPLKLFPRGAAMAFMHWNPFGPHSNTSTVENLVKNTYRLKSYGVPTSKTTSRYCEKYLHHCFGKK